MVPIRSGGRTRRLRARRSMRAVLARLCVGGVARREAPCATPCERIGTNPGAHAIYMIQSKRPDVYTTPIKTSYYINELDAISTSTPGRQRSDARARGERGEPSASLADQTMCTPPSLPRPPWSPAPPRWSAPSLPRPPARPPHMLLGVDPLVAGRRAAATTAAGRRSGRSTAAGLAAGPATALATPSGDYRRRLRLRSSLTALSRARALKKLVCTVLLVRQILVVGLRPALPELEGYQAGVGRLLLALGLRRHRLQHSDDIVTCAMCTHQQCAGLGVAARGRSGPPLSPWPRPSYWACVHTSWRPGLPEAAPLMAACLLLPSSDNFVVPLPVGLGQAGQGRLLWG